jgi:hypothetical protein
MSIVFTPASLLACLLQTTDKEWFENPSTPTDGTWDALSLTCGNTIYIIHRTDGVDSRRIVLISTGNPFVPAPSSSWRRMLERVQRASIAAERSPVRLPPDWSEYHAGNLIAFFAGQHRDCGDLRWVMEFNIGNSRDICFWRLTSASDQVQLKEFSPTIVEFADAVSDWKHAFTEVSSQFAALPLRESTARVDSVIDLEAVTFGTVVQHRRYTEWLRTLTIDQTKFITQNTHHAIKLRGPAGSGKTLALELKLLQELYGAQDRGVSIRLLYITQSWSMAEQVDSALRRLDERGDLSSVDILPLLTMPQLLNPREQIPSGVRLLGEDNLEGKRLQLERISSVLAASRAGDWLAFRSRTSDEFRARVESTIGSSIWESLIWDLMNEFSCVLAAHSILPGVNAERRYLAMHRTSWMMPLLGPADKLFVLRVYTDYVESLRAEATITSDQRINDFLNYLETFEWNIRRERDGYDVIFVDELHLFSEQERLIFHYLTRTASEYPAIFMALDPRQAPNEVYAKLPTAPTASADSGEADLTFGPQKAVDLTIVHRFSSEILALIRHIHHRYPALDLGRGEDWKLELDSVTSSLIPGKPPVLFRYMSAEQETRGAIARAESLWQMHTSSTAAVLVIDPMRLEHYLEYASAIRANYCKIAGRDDIAQLGYRKRSLIIAGAEFTGGMQFDIVVVTGLFDIRLGSFQSGHQLRRLLSLLYLAISRARGLVELHICEADGGLPEVLSSAVANGALLDTSAR